MNKQKSLLFIAARRFVTLLLGLCGWLALPAQAALTFNAADNTVTDSVTGLIWDRCALGLTGPRCVVGSVQALDWISAMTVAQTANTTGYSGHKDWRLPNIRELRSLVDIQKITPAIDPVAFPASKDSFWTSTLFAGDSSYAWSVSFNNGYSGYDDRHLTGQVRLVRGGQPFADFDSLAPTVTAVSPTSDSTAGGTSVTLTGSNLTGATAVTIGGNACTTMTVVSATAITCTTPAGTAGTASVLVTTPVGTNAANALFTYGTKLTYAITASVSPAGFGTATCTPNPVTVGGSSTCAATPIDGYNFSNWSGDCSGTTCSLSNVSSNQAVTANFFVNMRAISTSVVSGSGSIKPEKALARPGETVSFVITPTPGYVIASATGCGGSLSGSASPYTYTTGAITLGCTVAVTFSSTAQTVTFTPPSPVSFGASPITLSATASSDLTAFTFSAPSDDATICTVSGNTLTIVGAGTCHLTATQTGSVNYAIASASANVVITPAILTTQTITGFTPPSSVTLVAPLPPSAGTASGGGNQVINLSAKGGGSGNPVVFATSSIGTICTVSGSQVILNDVGTCNLTANQAGNSNYAAAAQVTGSITIVALNGQCGDVRPTTFAPTEGLCKAGSASPVLPVNPNSPWTWTCIGVGQGHTNAANCTALKAGVGVGVGTGKVTAAVIVAPVNGWVVDPANSGFVAQFQYPPPPPSNVKLPFGLLNLRLTGQPGSKATVTISYSQALPDGTVYYKYGSTPSNPTFHWYKFPNATISNDRLSITLTLTDDQDGDDAYNIPGLIEDPGGPALEQDTTPPITTAGPTITRVGTGQASAQVTINEVGTGYWLLQPTNAAAPGVDVLTRLGTSVAMLADTAASLSLSPPSPGTGYTLYFVAKDTTGNLQTSVSRAAFTSAPASNQLDGLRGSYTITRSASGFVVTPKTAGGPARTVAADAAAIKFDDFSVNLLIGGVSKTIAAKDLNALIELYVAFFNRIPEADGLAYWINRYKVGMTLDQIADSFYAIGIDYSSLTGYTSAMSNADFVGIVYQNVLNRSGANKPPAADVQYWVTEYTSGRISSKGRLVQSMLASAHSYSGDPTWGWVAQLLDRKITVASYFAVEQGLNYNTPQESITQGMAIARAVKADSTAAALALIGFVDVGFNLALP